MECIGRGKARKPYDSFSCKVSIATPITAPKGGQFVLHAKALHGNPDDGHTLDWIIAAKMRRRAAVEPVIGHLKDDHRMRDASTPSRRRRLQLSLLRAGFEELLRALPGPRARTLDAAFAYSAPETFFTDDQGRGGWQTVDALKKRGRQEAASKPLEPLASYAAALRRRLARASSPPAASISPGTPAPTMGPGTARNAGFSQQFPVLPAPYAISNGE